MDFFEHQDLARKKSGRLVLLFGLAVITLVVAANLLVAALTGGGEPVLHGLVTLGILVVIALGSLWRLASLRGGGRVVAEQLGGRLLVPGQAGAKERVLLNVVEEMSIASGTPVPPVYVLEGESGINAFAAGYEPKDAVIGVTRGAIERLSRDELQGVIAHEFSHVLHGDMRLNIRLMGVLYGILLLGLIGGTLLRSLHLASLGRNNRQGGGVVPLVLGIGVALMVVGYAGTFFGNLIKAAVSRQREFLADASAVQYTRNPTGIAGALMKVGGLREGSRIQNPGAPEASHLFFGSAVPSYLGKLSATHPPLEERVVRLVPSLRGRLSKAFAGDRAAQSALQHGAAGLVGDLAPPPAAGKGSPEAAKSAARPAPERRASVLEQAGEPTPEHLVCARALLESLPEGLREAARDPYGARALVHALLLDERPEVLRAQRGALARTAPEDVRRAGAALAPDVRALSPEARLALLELAVGSLRGLSPKQLDALFEEVDGLIDADGETTFEEVALAQFLHHQLDPQRLDSAARVAAREASGSLAQASEPAALALAALARAGKPRTPDGHAARVGFAAGWKVLGLPERELPPPPARPRQVAEALDQLARLAPRERRRLLAAAAGVVEADGKVTAAERELFRLFAEALDVPLPPVLPGQSLA